LISQTPLKKLLLIKTVHVYRHEYQNYKTVILYSTIEEKLQDGNPIFNHRGGGLLQHACVGGTVDLHLLAVNIKCKHHIALLSIKVRVIKT